MMLKRLDNNQIKVSIIVPVYNVKKFLVECLNSVINQTLKEIEIIIMDDGSTDGSGAIIDDFAKKDPRIIAVHKTNEGYGKTINRALDIARGEYIGIVESDDFIELDMYERLYNLAIKDNTETALSSDCKQQDVKSSCNYYDVVKGSFSSFSKIEDNRAVKLFSDDIVGKTICARNSDHNEVALFATQACIWSAVYKHSFLKVNGIRFLETPGASFQDISFNFKILALANRVYLTNEPLYHYRQHPGQSVHSDNKLFCVCDEWDEIERFMDGYPKWKQSSARLRNLLRFYAYYWNYRRLAKELRPEFKMRFIEDFRKLSLNGDFSPDMILSKKIRYWCCLTLNPHDRKSLLKKHLYNVQRLFLSSRVKDDIITYYTMLGRIKLCERSFKDKRIWPKFN